MLLWRLIWSFIRKPKIGAPVDPETFPPDGSMFFGEPGWNIFGDVAEPYVQYEFSDNCDEDNHDVEKLGLEIVQQLCEQYVVLTKVVSENSRSEKKPVKPAQRFPVRYHSFLKNAHPKTSAYLQNERELYVRSEGFDRDLYYSYTDVNTSDWCALEYYLFRKTSAPASAEEGCKAVQDGRYDMCLFLTNGPVALELFLNRETVDAASIRAVAESVCKKHDILFYT